VGHLAKLQVEERIRDSAMFNLAIHSKLRSCDVVRLEDVARMARPSRGKSDVPSDRN
jgi:hypothetical protein